VAQRRGRQDRRAGVGPHRGKGPGLKKLTALLDAAAGIEYEGESPPEWTDDDITARQAFNLLANGTGAFDWAGLPFVVAYLGVTDIDLLIYRLALMKLHRPPKEDN
jgi:hypothetical protein